MSSSIRAETFAKHTSRDRFLRPRFRTRSNNARSICNEYFSSGGGGGGGGGRHCFARARVVK